MTIGWFALAYNTVMDWKQRIYAYVRAIPAYQRFRAMLGEVKARIKARWRAMFEA